MDNAIITYTGQKGSGKTTALKQAVASCRRAIYVDPEGKWQPGPYDAIALSSSQLMQFLGDVGSSDPRVPFRVIYRDDAEQLQRVPFALAFALRNVTVVVDEWAWICTAQQIPLYLKRIIQFGRERRINLVGTTREPQEVHNLLFSQADLVLIFHTNPGLGLDRLRRWYPDIAMKAPALQLHQCVRYGDAAKLALLGREGLDLKLATAQTYPAKTTFPR